jgi:DNA helicase HerA-like ATPase
VYLGQAVGTYGSDEVWYDPQKPDEKLNNPHISITGETGTGKTQATKAILHELLRQGIPALILDFKDDYSKSDYAEAEGFTVHDASWGSLPFNPMVPVIDRLSGRVNVTSHLHELSNMLQRIYKLGDQQAFALREAMKETYEINGISMKPFVPSPDQQYLPFEAIREVLVREDATTLLGRLSPVFDLGLFSEGDGSVTLAELLATPTVIRLGQLPGDQVKNAVAEFFLMALHSFLMRREQPHSLRQVLVLDEAWRLVDSPRLNPLMLEGRAFGLGVIVATQFPKQLPDEVSGSTATRLFFGQAKAEQVREIQKTLVGKTSGADADHVGSVVRALAPLECVAMNSHYRPWVKVKTVPYFARMEAEVPESGD